MGTLDDRRALYLHEDRDERRLTEIFRALVYERAKAGDFLGADVGAILTAEFDSVMNGVDLVLELRHPDRTASHLAASVEVVVPWSAPWDPLDQVRSELERDEVAPVKYFESRWLGYKGPLRAPRVHLGISAARLLDLLPDWQADSLRLSGSAAHRGLLLGTVNQLAVYGRFAEVRERKDSLSRIRAVRDDVEKILETLGMREAIEDEGAEEDVSELNRRLFEVFGDVLEEPGENGEPEAR